MTFVLSRRPVRRLGRRILDLFLGTPAFRPRQAFAHPASQEEREGEDRGLAIIEMITGYGLYVLVGAIAIALAAGIYLSLASNAMHANVRSIVVATQDLHANVASYAGLSANRLAISRLIDTELVFAFDDSDPEACTVVALGTPPATDNCVIRIEGAGDNPYRVSLAAGGNTATTGTSVGATNNRRFVLSVWNIDDADDCATIASADYNGLTGVQIRTAAAVSTTVPTPLAAPAATLGADATAYQNPPVTAGTTDLDLRQAAVLSAACATDEFATVHLGFR